MLSFFYNASVYYTRSQYRRQARGGRLCLGLVDKKIGGAALKEVKKWAEGLCPYEGGWNVMLEKSLPGIQYDGTEDSTKAPLFATVKEDCVLFHDLITSPAEKALTLVTEVDGVTISGTDLFDILSISQATALLHDAVSDLVRRGELAIKDGKLVKSLEEPNGLMPKLHENAPGPSEQPA